jgi:hypothetical protein
MKENEFGGTCCTHGRGEKRVQGFGRKTRREMITWKKKAYMGGPWVEWLVLCGVDSPG